MPVSYFPQGGDSPPQVVYLNASLSRHQGGHGQVLTADLLSPTALSPKNWVGRRGVFRITPECQGDPHQKPPPNFFHGTITHFKTLSPGPRYYRYRITQVCPLTLLKRPRPQRVFYGHTTEDIITQVLTAAGWREDNWCFNSEGAGALKVVHPLVVQSKQSDMEFLWELLDPIQWTFHLKHTKKNWVCGFYCKGSTHKPLRPQKPAKGFFPATILSGEGQLPALDALGRYGLTWPMETRGESALLFPKLQRGYHHFPHSPKEPVLVCWVENNFSQGVILGAWCDSVPYEGTHISEWALEENKVTLTEKGPQRGMVHQSHPKQWLQLTSEGKEGSIRLWNGLGTIAMDSGGQIRLHSRNNFQWHTQGSFKVQSVLGYVIGVREGHLNWSVKGEGLFHGTGEFKIRSEQGYIILEADKQILMRCNSAVELGGGHSISCMAESGPLTWKGEGECDFLVEPPGHMTLEGGGSVLEINRAGVINLIGKRIHLKADRVTFKTEEGFFR